MKKTMVKRIIGLIRKPANILLYISKNGYLKWMSDQRYVKMIYRLVTHEKLDLIEPKSFSEKMQWLKLHDRNDEYTRMVDKFLAKGLVAQTIGEEYIIPTLKVWKRPQDIDFSDLPDKFVLKVNHDSGGVIVCRDKNKLDRKKAIKKLEKCLKNNGYWYGREWPYKNVEPLILAEEFLEQDSSDDLIDYKFYCFNGMPQYCQVISNRNTNETIDFYDMSWNLQVFSGLGLPVKPHSPHPISRPKNLEKMIRFSELLSQGISFLRVDFYEVKGHLYFGEMTFYPASGFGKFSPNKFNYIIGDHITLPIEKKNSPRAFDN